ncbi:hypothetical protein BCU70_04530 [Vibrio sp. 10N.286.49.C2]|uniref:DUF2989 domain-containing protein n=1 Tax=unclassified Vibrio TaxID=2614977 RepID=UPI000C86268A|nr:MULTISPECIES: DUF2989 domain-containing protein [unclassified Vibrio]PMH33759.1 hypothetical protein BCU70_04530 [Vibrio sp. 10N.286.49.C2]PMH44016.1 hypothetical protein BCU66_03440 [Vibrio sp. 10N.286.49.B1]PMH78726.1 hypothetical protein BCU58_08030 [Vibrio sp. 10N.286.48.B7]
MKIHYAVLLLASSSLLTGCFESRKNTDQVCSSEPGLECSSLNVNDGQCRIARTDLIWHRYETLDTFTEPSQIEEFYLLREYRKCLELASQIQPIEQAALKEKRFNALVYAIDEQMRIQTKLMSSTKPETLYFLWSETGNTMAKRRFLAMEGDAALETAAMQYALATYYISRDKLKTHELLVHSLELSSDGNINTDALKSLASVNYTLSRPRESYLWTMVGKQFNIPIVSDNELKRLFALNHDEYRQLDEQAEAIVSSLESGAFNRSQSLTTLSN